MSNTNDILETIMSFVGVGIIGYTILTVLPKQQLQQYPVAATAPPPSTGGGGNTPARLGYKATGKKVAMETGANHRNGQRYNVNHSFTNYVMMGFFKTSTSQEAINHKTDGPNHGSCTSLPKCVWVEPHLDLTSGKVEMQSEWPHPKNHNVPCPSCKTFGNLKGKEIGWAIAAFNCGGFRKIEVWVDPTGTGSKWTKAASEIDKGQLTNATLAKRQLPTGGKGLESEIRMHGATSGGTGMRDAAVWEITPPACSAGTTTTTTTAAYGNVRWYK